MHDKKIASQNNSVESHSVDIIPRSARTGKVWQLGPFWFAANQQLLTVVVGALAIIFGLDLFWAIIAILIGNLIGAIFMAYHSAQGPILGVTQMIQSRGQFGFYGGVIIFLCAFFLQFGFFASASTLGAQAINSYAPSISVFYGLFIISIPILFLAIMGYKTIYKWQYFSAIVTFVVFLIITVDAVVGLFGENISADIWSLSSPNWAIFLAVVSVAATYALTWAPFVSDYSRYLPENTKVNSCFWWTYGGVVISGVWLQVLGSIIVVLYPKMEIPDALHSLSGSWVLLIMALSMIGAATTNLYSGMLALVSCATTFMEVTESKKIRIFGIGTTFAIGFLMAVNGYDSFLNNFENFLLVLAFIFIPWTAINLTDFYIIKHGKYDVESFFSSKGIYGKWNIQSLAALFIGFVAELIFLNQELYTGPMAKYLGGADISWIVGLVVSGVLYYTLCLFNNTSK